MRRVRTRSHRRGRTASAPTSGSRSAVVTRPRRGGGGLGEDGPRPGQVALERDDGAGGVEPGRSPPVADGVEGVRGRRERRGGCREHRDRAPRPPRARCGRAGRRAGCARRPTGRGRGSASTTAVSASPDARAAWAAARCSSAVRVGPSSTPARRGPVIRRSARTDRATTRATTARPSSSREPDRPRREGSAGDRAAEQLGQPVPEPLEQALLLVVDRPCAARPRATPGPARDVGSSGGSRSHRVSGPRRHSATERVRPAAPRG